MRTWEIYLHVKSKGFKFIDEMKLEEDAVDDKIYSCVNKLTAPKHEILIDRESTKICRCPHHMEILEIATGQAIYYLYIKDV